MKSDNRQKVIRSLLLFAGVFVIGIAGYMLIEGWHLLDAAFMTVITLGTVGYGETNPLSPQGRIFTILLIIFGLGAAASVLNSFANMLIETKLDNFLGRKAMTSELKRLKGHVILCGFGQIGTIIALRLMEKQIPFVVIETDDNEIEKIKQMGFLYVQGELTADMSLLTAGIDKAKSLVICIPDMTTNLTLALAAKDINPAIEVIAQGTERTLESRLIRAGASSVVYPLALGGEQISDLIANHYQGKSVKENTGTNRIDGFYLKLYRHFTDEPLSIGEAVARENGIRAVSWRSGSKVNVIDPDLSQQLCKGDALVVVVQEQLLNAEDKPITYQSVSKIVWQDAYSVGLPAIDEEHLRLINLINQFNEALVDEKAHEILVSTFDRLIDYSVEHFKNEEALMRSKQYEGLEAHIAEHQRLMETVMALNQEKRYLFPKSVSEFLNMWLVDHILDCDMQYVDALKD